MGEQARRGAPASALEIWGGFECTVARLGDAFRDQLAETGHRERLGDLDAVAELGITKLRYGVLWEVISPRRPDETDWSWTDSRLARARELGLGIIAGLVHHGSGPIYTNLLDENFPLLFSRHAERVAQRYPWIDEFTPVNEPATTARFSCLYGLWYPHLQNEAAFLRALFTQCKATVLAMRAIRRITPGARLIQTEDLGRVFSSPAVAQQADYENTRRWLSFDLLTGRVDRTHPFYERFVMSGIDARELAELTDAPCPPDVIGINHYLTSDRFLDDDTTGYPPESIGGNGYISYADVAAVRVAGLEGATGLEARLREAWERYGLPLAVTEVHNGSTRDEQLRWLMEAWSAVRNVRSDMVPVTALTVWALVGAVDWTSLLTERRGDYETGSFDARSTPPRATALAGAVRQLAREAKCEHAVLEGHGWWKRPDRYHRPVAGTASRPTAETPILITGKTGTLGAAFGRGCERRGLSYVLLGRDGLDIADAASVRAAIQTFRPWALVNTAGFVRVPEADRYRDRCMRENALGAAVLAEVAAEHRLPLVTFSSDLVFDGLAGRPYVESDPPSPACVYGHSKALAERSILDLDPGALVLRTSAFFGPWDRANFAWTVISALRSGRPFEAEDGLIVSPTFVPDLVDATLDLVIDRAQGIWHVTNDGSLSWWQFARLVATTAGYDEALVLKGASDRSASTALRSEKGMRLPSVEHAVARFSRALMAS